jgi:putative spermidine/putrescine transport system permease protein
MRPLRSFFFVLTALLFALPLLLLLQLSFGVPWRFPQVFPSGLTLDHWKALSQNQKPLFLSLALSLLISIPVAALATAGGFMLSRAIAFSRYKNLLTAMAYLPFVLSPVIFASLIGFYFIFFDLSGIIPGVMLAQLFITLPFALLLFVDYWDIKLKSLEDLVLTLGGTTQQAFAKVIAPVSKNILLLCFFQTFLISWFDYGLTSIIGVGKVQTLTVMVFQFIGEANPHYAAVSSCLLIFPALILLFFNKHFLFNKLQ